MAYNFNNPFNFPWSSHAFMANGFTGTHPNGTPQPPGFSPDTVFPGGRFPAIFPYGMPFQGADNSTF